MKLILEIEPGDDLQHLEPILKLLKPYLSRIQPIDSLLHTKKHTDEVTESSDEEVQLFEKDGVWVAQVTATGNLETAVADQRAQRAMHILQAV